MRNFETGATRNSDEGKMQYARIFDPGVERAFAEYMESQRVQADGKVRDPDNWKKGIPVPSYLDSQRRHWHDVWCLLTGRPDLAEEKDLVTALCALKFNVDGMLFEVLKCRQPDLVKPAPKANPAVEYKPAICEIAHETIAEEDLCEQRRINKAVEDADGTVTVTPYHKYPSWEERNGRIPSKYDHEMDEPEKPLFYTKHPEWRVCK